MDSGAGLLRIVLPLLAVAAGWDAPAIPRASPAAQTWQAPPLERGTDLLVRTERDCFQARLVSVNASGLIVSMESHGPRGSDRHLPAADVHVLVQIERSARGSRVAKTVVTAALATTALAAAFRGRPRTATALGLSAWWVPWWNGGRSVRGVLVFASARARALPPHASPCGATVDAALAGARRPAPEERQSRGLRRLP
jgi:hypothetical protein